MQLCPVHRVEPKLLAGKLFQARQQWLKRDASKFAFVGGLLVYRLQPA